jgi:hypothetical protein
LLPFEFGMVLLPFEFCACGTSMVITLLCSIVSTVTQLCRTTHIVQHTSHHLILISAGSDYMSAFLIMPTSTDRINILRSVWYSRLFCCTVTSLLHACIAPCIARFAADNSLLPVSTSRIQAQNPFSSKLGDWLGRCAHAIIFRMHLACTLRCAHRAAASGLSPHPSAAYAEQTAGAAAMRGWFCCMRTCLLWGGTPLVNISTAPKAACRSVQCLLQCGLVCFMVLLPVFCAAQPHAMHMAMPMPFVENVGRCSTRL